MNPSLSRRLTNAWRLFAGPATTPLLLRLRSMMLGVVAGTVGAASLLVRGGRGLRWGSHRCCTRPLR